MSTIKVKDIQLYYEIHGRGQPLVFISGFSGDHTAWIDVIEHYSDKYQVIVFDNRGIGQSDCPDYPYTTEMMADDVAGLVTELKLGPTHFITHSFGGCIGQTLAYKYSELVKSMVIADAPFKVPTRALMYAETRLKMMQAKIPEEIILNFITMLCWSENYLQQLGMIEQLIQEGFFPITETGYKGQLHALQTFDATEWLHKIQVPCLIIGADDDAMIDVKQSQYIAATIPNAEYFCFKDVGHVPFVEQPEIFHKVVFDFIARYY